MMLRVCVAVVCGLAALFVAGQRELDGGASRKRDRAHRSETAPAGVAARFVAYGDAQGQAAVALDYRGVAIQVQSGFGPVETYRPLLREVAALGADTVMLCPSGFMEHAKSQGIYIDARKCPGPQEFRALVSEARAAGLRVIVMPILLLARPRGSEWRGVIEPPDWPDWWRQYREFVIYFADIARDGGAEALIVGSELVSTERNTAEWVRVIEAAREHFPGGRLGYSANWDHYKPVQFWDKLDFVGMTSYYTLADKDMPSVEEIVAKWRPIHAEITRWQKQVGRPIVFTEVGWCSQKGAARAPWNYYHNQRASRDGLEEQRRLYEAFLQVWDGTPGVAGLIWWEWTAGAGGETDFGYTPKGKPAEALLREWLKRKETQPPPRESNGE